MVLSFPQAHTFEYANTILTLMTRDMLPSDGPPKPKCLIIGGGIANFTNVSAIYISGVGQCYPLIDDGFVSPQAHTFEYANTILTLMTRDLAVTRYCHYQYCMAGIGKQDGRGKHYIAQ